MTLRRRLADRRCLPFPGGGAGVGAAMGRVLFPRRAGHAGRQETVLRQCDQGRPPRSTSLHQCPDCARSTPLPCVGGPDTVGPRMGRTFFFYSISLDPKNDTPGGDKVRRRSLVPGDFPDRAAAGSGADPAQFGIQAVAAVCSPRRNALCLAMRISRVAQAHAARQSACPGAYPDPRSGRAGQGSDRQAAAQLRRGAAPRGRDRRRQAVHEPVQRVPHHWRRRQQDGT